MIQFLEQAKDLEPSFVNGDQVDLADVLDELRTPSLLCAGRVVVVDDADDFISDNRAALEKYCSAPSSTGYLVFSCDALAKNTRLFRVINDRGGIVPCDPPRGRTLFQWLTRRAETFHGKRLAESAAAKLVSLLGESIGVLDTELAKLAAYLGERNEITTGDVDTLTGHSREQAVFAVADALQAGDPTKALASWQQVLATDRAAPGRAIGGLAWKLRSYLEAQRDWEDGVSVHELARRLFLDPSLAEQRLRRTDSRKLERQQADLLSSDLATKTGLSNLETTIESWIVKHSAT